MSADYWWCNNVVTAARCWWAGAGTCWGVLCRVWPHHKKVRTELVSCLNLIGGIQALEVFWARVKSTCPLACHVVGGRRIPDTPLIWWAPRITFLKKKTLKSPSCFFLFNPWALWGTFREPPLTLTLWRRPLRGGGGERACSRAALLWKLSNGQVLLFTSAFLTKIAGGSLL